MKKGDVMKERIGGILRKIAAGVVTVVLAVGVAAPVVVPSGVAWAAGGTTVDDDGFGGGGGSIDGGTTGSDGLHGSRTDCVKTSILDGCNSVEDILRLVVNIMSVGIGVLAVIGLTISGIQYMTAGGNEERTRKSKRRIFEIVIGLAVYVGIYLILQWLMPGFSGV